MTVVTEEQVQDFKDRSTRDIAMPDGSIRTVRMNPQLVDALDFLLVMEEDVTESGLATFALEEMELRPELTFDKAYRVVVAHLYNRWRN